MNKTDPKHIVLFFAVFTVLAVMVAGAWNHWQQPVQQRTSGVSEAAASAVHYSKTPSDGSVPKERYVIVTIVADKWSEVVHREPYENCHFEADDEDATIAMQDVDHPDKVYIIGPKEVVTVKKIQNYRWKVVGGSKGPVHIKCRISL